MRVHFVALATLLAVSPCAPSARAETDGDKFPGQPSAQLALPRGWHRGATVDIEISGKGLFGPKDLLFYRGGIDVVSIEELRDRPMSDLSLIHI